MTPRCRAASLRAFEHAGKLGAIKKKLAVSGGSAGGNLAVKRGIKK